ncbi:hypothetical protein wCauA_06335 [Wolbachia endosymbiont of Carposina sasakii]|uniref:hypothetical protein n=1 Tax=Wolbachia endosymbiont of Carposina sasakii TaxID=2591635 RepID=UPI001144E829|nr:hypothetical protein [Wolbachia endosymbiont of Carposina sasakii]QDH19146.1 hypothetical protein wCauA_06335 [Wolbachia endosymbiont of Carposina sasakii]
MVESFSGNNRGSNFIEEAKIMENFSDNNGNGSSIFQGKIREQDFSAEQKLNELKAAIEELTRQDLLRRLECERQASSCTDEISSQAELHIGQGDDENYFTGEKGRVLGDFWNFFESLFTLFEVDVDDPKIYQMLKEKKEKNLIAAIMKFLRDKLKELIKKIFARDLSFNQRLDKEIKELQEKLGSGELSEEEFARALERLTALQDLKLRLQMAVVGWIVTMFAEMFGVELAAAVEASTEKEDKKAEKTSLKEENKEVCENVEMKVDEREKPKVPVFLFEISPGFVRPVVLSKPELEIVSDPLKHLLRLTELERKSHENSQKQKVDKEEKKAKPEEQKKEVCPQKPAEKGPIFVEKTGRSSEKSEKKSMNISGQTPTVGSIGGQKSSNTGKETINIDKICGELLAEQDQISPESELNSINVQPKGGYKGK